jgi:hypothetical protein
MRVSGRTASKALGRRCYSAVEHDGIVELREVMIVEYDGRHPSKLPRKILWLICIVSAARCIAPAAPGAA